jgi:threonyl-tRNA synthetase
LERFVGCLIEHFAGAFPLWLAPMQVRLLPITDTQTAAAEAIALRYRAAGVRADVDGRSETLNYKIRDAEMLKIPYMGVMGPREVEQGTLAVRTRGAGKKQEVLEVSAFLARVLEESRRRSLNLGPSDA